MAGKDQEIHTYVKECAKCGSYSVRTINTEVRKMGQVYRKKICSDCGYRFSTVEVEQIVSDVDSMLREIEDLKMMNQELRNRIAEIKDYVRRV